MKDEDIQRGRIYFEAKGVKHILAPVDVECARCRSRLTWRWGVDGEFGTAFTKGNLHSETYVCQDCQYSFVIRRTNKGTPAVVRNVLRDWDKDNRGRKKKKNANAHPISQLEL